MAWPQLGKRTNRYPDFAISIESERTMARAFLSHSSEDKPYVDVVARRLNRSRVVYDRQNFEPGDDFRDAIRNGLNQSSMFVLFASARSLASTWVKFEIDEAEVRHIAGNLKSVLVIGIDGGFKVGDLPQWMQRALVIFQSRPSQAARLIYSKLLEHEGADRQPLFVGREDTLQDIARNLLPPGGAPTPQILVFSGLEGVGRRSVAKRALRDNLSLDFGPVLFLEETDDLASLYLMLLEDANALATRDDLKVAARAFRSAAPLEQVQLISAEIENVAKDNVALVIVDQGSLIEDSGMFKAQVASVFEAAAKSQREPYVVVVQRRRPPLAQTTVASRIESFAVQPLTLDATRRLLVQSLKSAKIPVPEDAALHELTPYLSGYPPAVQLAIGYAQRYGLDALVADKSALVDLKVRTFERILKKLQLDELDQLVLRVLGMEPGLSLDVLATLTDASTTELAPRVTKLIDHSVIVRYTDTLSLAAPMRDSVYREFGVISPNEYSILAQRLKDKYWKSPSALPSLDAVDATLYTVARGRVRELEEFADIILPSTLLKVATTAYHDRDWKVARDFAQRTIDIDSTLDSAWSILAKAYIRLAHDGSAEWSQAEAAVKMLKERGDKTYHYLSGFLNWKRGDLKAAVAQYKLAEESGDRGVAVYRDRAHCRYQLGLVADAQSDIKVALDKYPRNPFIVDLAAAIAIRGGQYDKAQEFLKDLAEVEPRKENYYHRLSTLHAAKGEFDRALQEADLASGRRPPLHEIFTNRIDILIELKRFDEALAALASVEQQFKGRAAKDVQMGLRCKLALRRGNWRDADRFYQMMQNKELPVHKSLRAELLRQKAADMSVSLGERNTAREESDLIAKQLTNAGAAFPFVTDEVDEGV